MTEIDKDLQIAETLLKELGLNLQVALDTLFAISFTTTFDYPTGNSCDTAIMRASAMHIGTNSVLFSFPKINPPPILDVNEDDKGKSASGMFAGDELYIVGIEYYGKGQWNLVGEFKSDSPSLDEYYKTKNGMLTVRVLK